MQETLVRFLGQKDPLEKGQATHSSILGLPLWLSWQRIHLKCGRPGFSPWVGKISWRRERLPTPVFWPGEFHGLYSPWGGKESDMAEQLSLFISDVQCCAKLLYSKESQLYTYMHSFLKKIFFSIMVYHRILNISFQKQRSN